MRGGRAREWAERGESDRARGEEQRGAGSARLPSRSLVLALNVLGVLCKRIWLLFAAFQTPNVQGAPGVSVGNANLAGATAFNLVGSHAPTAAEVVIAAGAAACAAAYLLAACALAYLLAAPHMLRPAE